MAGTARAYKKAAYEYGSAAPAYDNGFEADRLPKVEEAVKPQERTPVKTRENHMERNKIGVSLIAVFGIPAVLICSIILLSKYITLTRLSNEAVGLEKQITELSRETDRLHILYESTFDMEGVEDYAKNVLGMVKADGDQSSYIRSAKNDQVQIIEEQHRESGIARQLKNLWQTIRSYF